MTVQNNIMLSQGSCLRFSYLVALGILGYGIN